MSKFVLAHMGLVYLLSVYTLPVFSMGRPSSPEETASSKLADCVEILTVNAALEIEQIEKTIIRSVAHTNLKEGGSDLGFFEIEVEAQRISDKIELRVVEKARDTKANVDTQLKIEVVYTTDEGVRTSSVFTFLAVPKVDPDTLEAKTMWKLTASEPFTPTSMSSAGKMAQILSDLVSSFDQNSDLMASVETEVFNYGRLGRFEKSQLQTEVTHQIDNLGEFTREIHVRVFNYKNPEEMKALVEFLEAEPLNFYEQVSQLKKLIDNGYIYAVAVAEKGDHKTGALALRVYLETKGEGLAVSASWNEID